MELKDYLKETGQDYKDLARALSKHEIYINTVVNGAKPGPKLAIEIEAWTKGKVTRQELRPDLWQDAA